MIIPPTPDARGREPISWQEVAGIIGAAFVLCLLGGILWIELLSYRLLKVLSSGQTRHCEFEPPSPEAEPAARFETKDELHHGGARYD